MRLRRIKESLSNRTYADRESVLPDQSIKILWVLGLRATSFNEVFRIVAEDPTHIPTPFEVRRLQKYRADVIDELAELERFTLFLKNPVSNPDPATLVTDRLREYVQATEKDILGKYLLRFINPN